jgi:hypothetical protein
MAKDKIFPAAFSSYEEYDGYLNCLHKAQLGDEVIIYLCQSYDHRLTAIGKKGLITSQPLKVVGKKDLNYNFKTTVPILGMKDDSLCFWFGENIKISHDIKIVSKDVNSYSHFRICTPTDTLIAKIIRRSRP